MLVKTKSFKIACFCLMAALVFNFSFLAQAQEENPPAENPAAGATEEIITEPTEQPPVQASPTNTEPVIFELPAPENATSTPTTTEPEIIIDTPPVYDIPTNFVLGADIKKLTILGQWQMTNEEIGGQYAGSDDSTAAGSQFLPSGKYDLNQPVVVCAIAAGQNQTDIKSVAAQINYPKNIAAGIKENGEKIGCGQVKTQMDLSPLTNDEGTNLVCEKIRNNNNNLISWNTDTENNFNYDYEQICSAEGLLKTEQAVVYCAEADLSYADPAGDYEIKIGAVDNEDYYLEVVDNFKYLELTTFENDFSSIHYGLIKINQTKILPGDKIFGSAAPTVRNTGNTPLRIKIWQNDFGLGKTNDLWNLDYQAKVGESVDFISYPPEQTALLDKPLGLAETTNIDLGILVRKFPEITDGSSFWGKMTLTADPASAMTCE